MTTTDTEQGTQILENYLSANSRPQSVAESLVAAYNNDLQAIGSLILNFAQSRPSDTDQTALIRLVALLQAQIPPDTFQQFDWAVREAWNYSDPPDTDPQQASKREQWRNLNSFAARLAANDYTSILLNGLWTLRSALEDEEGVEGNIPAAAQWMIYAGSVIYQSTESFQPQNPKAGDPARPGKLFTGSSGFSGERWTFWKQGFQDAAASDDLSDETRGWASDTVEAMARAEADS